ncbi:MAG: hypothetical protein IAF58_22200 [Leptolyngbya sp.]|nr:hypothetical protein [Candidatus Melainabacteria bacterium]
MYKRVAAPPADLPSHVKTIYSVGNCGSPGNSDNFNDYIQFWSHNGYWFFNSPQEMNVLASENGIDLTGMTLFYYEAYELEFDFTGEEAHDFGTWSSFESVLDWKTEVDIPQKKQFVGFDVVEFVCRNSPECSLLSCSNVAAKSVAPVNSSCLYDTFAEAKNSVVSGIFHDVEPGPYRIFKVYLVDPS